MTSKHKKNSTLYAKLDSLQSKIETLSNLAKQSIVKNPPQNRRAKQQLLETVNTYTSEIQNELDELKNQWTEATGCGNNAYIISRSRRENKKESNKSKKSSNSTSTSARNNHRKSATIRTTTAAPTSPLKKRKLPPPAGTDMIPTITSTPPREPPSNGKEYRPASAERILSLM